MPFNHFNRQDITVHNRRFVKREDGSGEVFTCVSAPTSLPAEQWIALNQSRVTAVVVAQFSADSTRRPYRSDLIWSVYGQPMNRRGEPLATGVDWHSGLKVAIDWVLSSQRADGRIAPARLGIRAMGDLSADDRDAIAECLKSDPKEYVAEKFGLTLDVIDTVASDDRKKRISERDVMWRADAEIVPQLSVKQLAHRWAVCEYTCGVWLGANGLVRGSGRGKHLFGIRLAQYREHGGDRAVLAKLWHVGEGAVNAWASRWGVDRPRRLQDCEKEAIKKLIADGLPINQIAGVFGVSHYSISAVINPDRRDRRSAIKAERLADVKSGLYTRKEMAHRWGIGHLAVSNWILRNIGEGRDNMFLPTKRFDANRKSAGGWGIEDIEDAAASIDGIISEMDRRSSTRRKKVAINRIKMSIGRYIDATHNTASNLPSSWGMTERSCRKWLERHIFTPRRTVPTEAEREVAQKFKMAAMALLATESAHRPILSRKLTIDPRRTIWIDSQEMVGLFWAIGGIAIIDGGRLLKLVKSGDASEFEARTKTLFLSVANGEIYFNTGGLSGSFYPDRLIWEIVDEN